MFSVPHMIVLFIVVLVVFGPHKLPELAKGLGKLMAEFRKASTDFKLAFEEEMRNMERQAREAERKKILESVPAPAPAAEAVKEGAGTEEGKAPEVIEPVVAPVSEAVARGSEENGSTEHLDVQKAESSSGEELQKKALDEIPGAIPNHSRDEGHPA